MTASFRVTAPKEQRDISDDFDTMEQAEAYACEQRLRPLSVVRVIDKGTKWERYLTVVHFPEITT